MRPYSNNASKYFLLNGALTHATMFWDSIHSLEELSSVLGHSSLVGVGVDDLLTTEDFHPRFLEGYMGRTSLVSHLAVLLLFLYLIPTCFILLTAGR